MAGVIKLGPGDSITIVNDGLVDPGFGKPEGPGKPPAPTDPGWSDPKPDHTLPTDPHPDIDPPIAWWPDNPGEPPKEHAVELKIVWIPPQEEGAVGIFMPVLVPTGDHAQPQGAKRR